MKCFLFVLFVAFVGGVLIQSLSQVQLFATSWTVARQSSLSFTIPWSLLKFMSTESGMPFNDLILYCSLLLLTSVFPSIRVFPISWLLASGGQIIGASASALPMNNQVCFPLELTGWISLPSKGLARVFSNTTVQKHQFFCTQPSLQFNSHIHTWLLKKP